MDGIISGEAVNFGSKKKSMNNLLDKKAAVYYSTQNTKYSHNVGVLLKPTLKIIKVSGKILSDIFGGLLT